MGQNAAERDWNRLETARRGWDKLASWQGRGLQDTPYYFVAKHSAISISHLLAFSECSCFGLGDI